MIKSSPSENRERYIRDAVQTLETFWLAHPELRLGQIVANSTFLVKRHNDPFYIDDTLLFNGLGRLEGTYHPKQGKDAR